MPRTIVDREIPVARSTKAIPPCPNARASVAAQSRRDRSVNAGARLSYFARRVSKSTHQEYLTRRRKSSSYFVPRPKQPLAILMQVGRSIAVLRVRRLVGASQL